MLHSSGRSRFVLREGATLLVLREKAHTQIEDTSASPGRVPGAVVTPTFWDPPSAAISMEPTISGTPGTTIPADSLVFAVPTDANAGGPRYSRELCVSHRKPALFCAREAALVAWTHDMQTGTHPLPKSHLLDPHDLLPDDSARAP